MTGPQVNVMSPFQEALYLQLCAGFPAVSIISTEESRVVADLAAIVKADGEYSLFIWTATTGIAQKLPTEQPPIKDTEDLLGCCRLMEAKPNDKNYIKQAIIVLTDLHTWPLASQPQLNRALREFIIAMNTRKCMVVIVGPKMELPDTIEKLVTHIDYALPDPKSLERLAKNQAQKNPNKDNPIEILPETIRALAGLTQTEAINALTLSLVEAGKYSTPIINRFKVNAIKRAGLLEVLEGATRLEDIGGLENLLEWGKQRARSFTPAAIAYGVPRPKGCGLVGVPGGGKSLAAKVFGAIFGIPILRFDIGKVFGGIVGDSERNMRSALDQMVAMAPCVSGDTRIWLADGREVRADALPGLLTPDTRVMCWNERTRTMDTTSLRAVTVRKALTYQVTAALGFGLRSTGNHPHLVMRGGEPEWVRTDEIQSGDMMAVPMNIRAAPHHDARQYWPESMREVEGELRRGKGGWTDTTIPRLPTEVTADVAWVAAMVCEGDGHHGGDTDVVALTNTDEGLLTRFEDTCEQLFGKRPVRHLTSKAGTTKILNDQLITTTKDCYATKFGSQLAAEFLRNVWEHILAAPMRARVAALAAWFDSDGTFSEDARRVTLSIVSDPERRVALARSLLLSVGVLPGDWSSNNLYITNPAALCQVLDGYGIFTAQKAQAAAVLRDTTDLFTRGSGFACGMLLQTARRASGLSHRDIGEPLSQTWNIEQGNRPASEAQLYRYTSRLSNAGAPLQQLLAAECRWVTVEAVTPYQVELVYDLVCEGDDTHSFIANGMITHNCVCLVDEIEKGLAGADSSANDGGVTKRIFGTFITWLQENTAPVFIIVTANDVKSIPPEFLRKGRFDEWWAVDLPTARERLDIFRIHLRKRDEVRAKNGGTPLDWSVFNFDELVRVTESYVGAEIEAIVGDAWHAAFDAGLPQPTTDTLLASAKRCIPLATTASERVAAIREWGRTRARFASRGSVEADAEEQRADTSTARNVKTPRIINRPEENN